MQCRNLEFCKEETEHVLNKLLLRKFQNTHYFIAFLYSICRALFSAKQRNTTVFFSFAPKQINVRRQLFKRQLSARDVMMSRLIKFTSE